MGENESEADSVKDSAGDIVETKWRRSGRQGGESRRQSEGERERETERKKERERVQSAK